MSTGEYTSGISKYMNVNIRNDNTFKPCIYTTFSMTMTDLEALTAMDYRVAVAAVFVDKDSQTEPQIAIINRHGEEK